MPNTVERVETIENDVEKLRLALLRVKTKRQMRLFGACLAQFGLIMEPFESMPSRCMTACVSYSCSDRRFNIQFCQEYIHKIKVGTVIYVILHEILHVLYKHHSRGRFKKIEQWNQAADHVINFAIDNDINSGILDTAIKPNDRFLIKYFVDIGKKVTVEEAYAYLVDNTKTTPIKIKCPTCNGSGKVQSDNNDPNKSDSKSNQNKNQKEKDTDKTQQPCPTCEGQGTYDSAGSITEFHDPNTGQRQIVNIDLKYPDLADEINNDIDGESDNFTDQLISSMRSVKDIFSDTTKGTGSGSIDEMLNDLLKVHIPIEQLLNRAIATKLKPSSSSRSWRSLNRIYQSIGLFSPGRGIEENIQTGICVKDTSGSITTNDLKLAGGAILACSVMFKDMYVISHDYTITDEKYYPDGIDDELAITEDLKVQKGRGGTSHKDVFKRIQELYEKHNGLGIVIMITDYYSDITELFDSNQYPWCDHVPISILLTPNEKLDIIPKRIDPKPILIQKTTELI